MKPSRRNLRNARNRAEARSDGPPRVSKYAAKNGVVYKEPARLPNGGVTNNSER